MGFLCGNVLTVVCSDATNNPNSMSDEELTAAAAAATEQQEFEEDLKKSKKKSSKKKKEDADGEEVPKPKKKKEASSAAAPEEPAIAQQVSTEGVDDDLDAMFKDLQVKKKKKSSSSSAAASTTAVAATASATAPAKEARIKPESNPQLDRDQYLMLLGRVYDCLRANNPDLVEKKKALLRPPTVARIGTSRIMWTNFAEICKTMKRDQAHVMNYFLTELGTTGSMTAQEQFLLKGKFVPKYIESLLKKYIHEYVTCNMCHGVETKLQRDTNARMTVMTCDSCGASRAVATIQKGYVAATRATRKAARNATG